MKRFCNFFLCTVMCISVIFTYSSVVSAASVAKVKNVSVSSVSASTVTLKWKKVSGATGYQIYKYSAKKEKYAYVGKTTKNAYTDSSLTANKTYKYKVRAYKTKNKKNTYGAYSDVVKATTKLPKVTGLKTSYVGSGNVKLSWKKVKGAKGYEVFVYDAKKKTYVSKGNVTKNSCVLRKLSSNTQYKVKVVAYGENNGKVYGEKSSVLTFRTAIPTVASVKVADVTATSFTLKWSKVSGADGYQIYRYVSSEKKWKKVKTTSSTKYTVKNLKQGTAYNYKVRAYKKNGSSYNYGGYSSKITAGTLPIAPAKLSAKSDSKAITLTWKGKGKATGYEVSRYNASNGSWETIGKTTKNTYTDDTVKYTSTYTYRVRAYLNGEKTYVTDYTPSVTVLFESNYEPESIYSKEMAASGVAGYLYDPAEKCFYTSSDPWQRIAGYNTLYDVVAPIALINADTVRLKFTYSNKDWMIQLWKGQYGLVFYGAEIGVYTKPTYRGIEHYDCASDENFLKMSMNFYRNGLKKFSRPYGSYWWCTGFVPGNIFGAFDTLRIEARITMKDYKMLSAMKKALSDEKVTKKGVTYSVNGLNVYITY